MTELDLVTDEVLEYFLGVWLNSNVLLQQVGHPSKFYLTKDFLKIKVHDVIMKLADSESKFSKEYYHECELKRILNSN